jgi:hypothetical protein
MEMILFAGPDRFISFPDPSTTDGDWQAVDSMTRTNIRMIILDKILFIFPHLNLFLNKKPCLRQGRYKEFISYYSRFTPPYHESHMNGKQRRSTWLIDNRDYRITVAGQRLILTDFAIMPTQWVFPAPLPYSVVKIQVNYFRYFISKDDNCQTDSKYNGVLTRDDVTLDQAGNI